MSCFDLAFNLCRTSGDSGAAPMRRLGSGDISGKNRFVNSKTSRGTGCHT